MPISTDSNAWVNAKQANPIEGQVISLLHENEDQAYSIQEIEEHIFEEYQNLFPGDLVSNERVLDGRAIRQSIIFRILEHQYNRQRVTMRYVSAEEDGGARLYFTWDGPGIKPIAEIDGVKDVSPEKTRPKLASRFRQIENDVDLQFSELNERITDVEDRLPTNSDTN